MDNLAWDLNASIDDWKPLALRLNSFKDAVRQAQWIFLLDDLRSRNGLPHGLIPETRYTYAYTRDPSSPF